MVKTELPEPLSHAAVWRPPTKGQLHIRMPFALDNRKWLKQTLGNRVHVERDGPYWKIARHHLWGLVDAMAHRYGEVDVILDFRTTERCDTRCTQATSDECVCACAGANHGGLADALKDWLEVGDSTLISTSIERRHFRVTRKVPTRTYNALLQRAKQATTDYRR